MFIQTNNGKIILYNYFFQSEKVIDKEVLNDKAAEIIEDPESYNQYIKRLEVIREKKK